MLKYYEDFFFLKLGKTFSDYLILPQTKLQIKKKMRKTFKENL